jgi:hypothetical protein
MPNFAQPGFIDDFITAGGEAEQTERGGNRFPRRGDGTGHRALFRNRGPQSLGTVSDLTTRLGLVQAESTVCPRKRDRQSSFAVDRLDTRVDDVA